MDAEDVVAGGSGPKKKKAKVKPGSFQGLGLSQATYKAVMRMGYNMPTPIQRKTIPTILDGQDIVAMARTGSGKTAAFLIPMVERLKCHSVSVGLRGLALSPTRELAMQTAKFFRQLSHFSDLRCCLLVGGQAMEAQFEHLANNPDVIIATPGRLVHHILEAELSLSRVEMLVIDEADRLFELGFAEQLQKILDATPISRQCLLFSATLPAQLVAFSRAGVKDPVFVRLDVETTLSDSLDLWYLYVRKDEKIAAAVSVLKRLAEGEKSTIMFVATRHHVEFFGELLKKLGMSVAIVYGAMDQTARIEQVSNFRNKKARILVTTDVAARGIDVPLLDHVLNFDFPPSGKLFVHRAGRTARAGRSGLAVSLVAMDDLPYTVELMLFLGRKLRAADGSGTQPWGVGTEPLLGAMPSLQFEVEELSALLEDDRSDLGAFHKSMIASYHLYYKTRPSASRQSVARTKLLLEECGGPARLQSLVHPGLLALGGEAPSDRKVAAAAMDRAFIEELRGFRPKVEKVGNVLSTSAIRTMEAAKLDASAVAAVSSGAGAAGPAQSGVISAPAASGRKGAGAGAGAAATTGRNRPAKRKRDAPKAKAQKVRMSKRARRNLRQNGPEAATEDFDDFDVKVDGKQLGAGASTGGEAGPGGAKAEPTEQFFLSTERDPRSEAKERGLEMEQYQLDLMPDDASDIKKAKSVIRWDNRKKKYLPVMVSVDGRAVKQSTRRDESGAKVRGEAQKSNMYKKWVKTSKKRIQKVGEMEQAYQQPLSRAQGAAAAAAAAAARTVEFDDAGDTKASGEGAKGATQRKPVVPFHGTIEAKYLTNKQKRLLKRRQKKDRIMEGPTRSELKTPVDIQKEKRLKERKSMKQKPHLRKQKGREIKEARKQMHLDRQMKYGARTKSKMLIFEGTTKVRRKTSGYGPRGMPSL